MRKDILIAPALEAALILVIALAGWVSHNPFVFAGLGPTAFEMVETPRRASAMPYNIIMGNLVAVIAAFAALFLTRGWDAPPVSAAGVPLARVWAVTIAAMLTVFVTLLIKATQPAALSTTLLIASGIMQTARDAIVIMGAVILITALAEPVRRWRAKQIT